MAERNPRPGDNWQLRYDCMKFHIPTSFCELPYMGELANNDTARLALLLTWHPKI